MQNRRRRKQNPASSARPPQTAAHARIQSQPAQKRHADHHVFEISRSIPSFRHTQGQAQRAARRNQRRPSVTNCRLSRCAMRPARRAPQSRAAALRAHQQQARNIHAGNQQQQPAPPSSTSRIGRMSPTIAPTAESRSRWPRFESGYCFSKLRRDRLHLASALAPSRRPSACRRHQRLWQLRRFSHSASAAAAPRTPHCRAAQIESRAAARQQWCAQSPLRFTDCPQRRPSAESFFAMSRSSASPRELAPAASSPARKSRPSMG
jgi:hypothetical protein